MYGEQLSRWVAVVPRKHLLVLSFDKMVSGSANSALISFLGLHTRSNMQLPDDNEPKYPGTVNKPTCDSRDALAEIFSPWNERLYRQVDSDRARGLAPPQEPEFGKFSEAACWNAPPTAAELATVNTAAKLTQRAALQPP